MNKMRFLAGIVGIIYAIIFVVTYAYYGYPTYLGWFTCMIMTVIWYSTEWELESAENEIAKLREESSNE